MRDGPDRTALPFIGERQQGITRQNGLGASVHEVGRGPSPSQLGVIKVVVMQQRGRMQQFERTGNGVIIILFVTHGSGEKQSQHGPDALAAGTYDVFCDTFDKPIELVGLGVEETIDSGSSRWKY